MCNTDVAAVTTRFGAELTLEIGRKTEDGGGDSGGGGEGGGWEMTTAVVVVVVGGWKRGEIGIGTAFEGENAVET